MEVCMCDIFLLGTWLIHSSTSGEYYCRRNNIVLKSTLCSRKPPKEIRIWFEFTCLCHSAIRLSRRIQLRRSSCLETACEISPHKRVSSELGITVLPVWGRLTFRSAVSSYIINLWILLKKPKTRNVTKALQSAVFPRVYLLYAYV